MSTNIDKTKQRKMQKALDLYIKDKNSVKEFYPCTQELTLWLQNKVIK